MKPLYQFIQKFHDQLIHCSRCGFCQVACPVYQATLRPALNPRGKMLVLKDLLEGRLSLSEELLDVIYQCTGCALCARHCPAGVNVAEILTDARKDLIREGVQHPTFHGLAASLATQKTIYGLEHPAAFKALKINRRAETLFFRGCVGSFREVESTQQTLVLLDRLKVDYTLIDEVCCSGVLEQVGFALNRSLIEHNIEAILSTGAKTVVTECPNCFRTFTLKAEYQRLREEDIEVIPLVRFLRRFDFGVKTTKRVTYHDPCDLGRHAGLYDDPRQIIRKLTSDYVELSQHSAEARCCGAGGGMRGGYPGTSIAMAGLRLQEALAVEADILLTNCNSCLHNFKNAQKRYSPLRRNKLEIYNLGHFINLLLSGEEREEFTN
jgi:Fe-S oxidoreductase